MTSLPQQQAGPRVAVALDVAALDRSCAFYQTLLGFQVVDTERPGMIYEQRRLRSTLVPELELSLRAAFGRRPIGSTPGSMRRLTIRGLDVAAAIERLGPEVRWVGPAPAEVKACVQVADPDGYVLELVAG